MRSSQRPQTQSRALIGPSGTPSDHLRFICATFAGHGGRGAAGASALDRGPDGRLHEVPRRIFNVWCKEMGITRADNLSRACNNRGLAGWHFSNETADKHGAWQPLHKLVFLQELPELEVTLDSLAQVYVAEEVLILKIISQVQPKKA